jgi:hypothetical protein
MGNLLEDEAMSNTRVGGTVGILRGRVFTHNRR